MKKELDPKYDHLKVEQEHYKTWIDNGYFTAGDKSKDPYCIVIPPPNVTGKLHLGHAWDTTLQDIVCLLYTSVHDIKAKELPEANDELVKQAEIKDVETLEAYKEYSRKNLETTKAQQSENKFESDILTAITDNAEVEIPEVMVEEETDNLVRDFAQRLQSQGFSLDQFKQVTGQSDEMIREEMGKDAFNKVKVRLVLEAIAAEEKIEISEEDVNAEIERIANMYGMETEKVRSLVSADAVSYDLRIRKALELVKDSVGK